ATRSVDCNAIPDQECSIYIPTTCAGWRITSYCNYVPPSATPYCGDGSCNNGETCSTCPGDCGSCGGSGGGDGGGGSCPSGNTPCGWCAGPSRDAGGCPAGNEMVSNSWC